MVVHHLSNGVKTVLTGHSESKTNVLKSCREN